MGKPIMSQMQADNFRRKLVKKFGSAKTFEERMDFIEEYGFTGLTLASDMDHNSDKYKRAMTIAVLQDTFKCKQCGKCCRDQDVVILNPAEIPSLARALNMKEDAFKERYVIEHPFEKGWFAIHLDGKKCPFIGEDNLCSVHADRPLICRSYPMETWHAEGFIEGVTRECDIECEAATEHGNRMLERMHPQE